MKIEYMFVLNIMVNELTCNHTVRSDSSMIVSILHSLQKLIRLKLGGIISCHIFVT